MSVHSLFRRQGRAVAALFLVAAAFVLSSCGGGDEASDVRTASEDGRRRALSTLPSGDGLYCAGSCWDEPVPGPAGILFGFSYKKCNRVEFVHQVTASAVGTALCSDHVKALANVDRGGKTGIVGTIVTCDVGPNRVAKAPCRELFVEVRPANLQLQPLPWNMHPQDGNWNQTFSHFRNPGPPPASSASDHMKFCTNGSLNQTAYQTCKADGTNEFPSYTGTVPDCERNNLPVLQWSELEGNKSQIDTSVEPEGKLACIGNMSLAVAGAIAIGEHPPSTPLVAAWIVEAGGLAGILPQCINAFTSNPYGFKEWTPVVRDGKSSAYTFAPPVIPANHEGRMTLEYKTCKRNQQLLWQWDQYAEVYDGMFKKYRGAESQGGYVWVPDPTKPLEALASMSQFPVLPQYPLRFNLDERVTATFTEACVQESERNTLGVRKNEWDAMVNGGWTPGPYFMKGSSAGLKACSGASTGSPPTPPTGSPPGSSPPGSPPGSPAPSMPPRRM